MEKLMPALMGVLAGAVLGGAVAYVVLSSDDHKPRTKIDDEVADTSSAKDGTPAPINDRADAAPDEDDSAPEGNENYKDLLRDAQGDIRDLTEERDQLQEMLDALETRAETLKSENDELKAELAELEPDRVNNLRVTFGGLDNVKELREADWSSLADAYGKMHPMLKEMIEAQRKGEEIPPSLMARIREQNQRLVNHFASVMGKLPTRAPVNGEFTHPVNMVNILAAQLEAAEHPLSAYQLEQLEALGEQYEHKWKQQEESYDDSTWSLRKILDEAELKQWFREEMFKITTQQQKEIAVPPEIEGIVGMDLYSPGLVLQQNVRPVRGADTQEIKENIKGLLVEWLKLDRTTLDSGEYIFDDWMATLSPQLQPLTTIEANTFYTTRILKAGRTQLESLEEFMKGFITDDEMKESFQTMEIVMLPQALKQE